jgi:hypothetical protein
MNWIVEKEYRDIVLLGIAIDKEQQSVREQEINAGKKKPNHEKNLVADKCPKMFSSYTPMKNDKMKVIMI